MKGRGVIEFPAWRRQADGAPGVARLTDDIDPLVPPVWHEGETSTGRRVIRVRADVYRAQPPIWRRLEFDEALTLDRVHLALAAAFEWDPRAPHVFAVIPPGRRRPLRAFGNAHSLRGDDAPHEASVTLARVLSTPRDRVRYGYGDGSPRGVGFELRLSCEDVYPAAEDAPPARVLGGRRAAPPEDMGTGAAYQLALAPTQPPFVASLVLPLPSGFDPSRFDQVAVDRLVRAALPDTDW